MTAIAQPLEKESKGSAARWVFTVAFHAALAAGVYVLKPPAKKAELATISVADEEKKPKAPAPAPAEVEEAPAAPEARAPMNEPPRSQPARAQAARGPAIPNLGGDLPSGGSGGGRRPQRGEIRHLRRVSTCELGRCVAQARGQGKLAGACAGSCGRPVRPPADQNAPARGSCPILPLRQRFGPSQKGRGTYA